MKKGLIDCGIEIVATANVVSQMSTGVSEYEQILIDSGTRQDASVVGGSIPATR